LCTVRYVAGTRDVRPLLYYIGDTRSSARSSNYCDAMTPVTSAYRSVKMTAQTTILADASPVSDHGGTGGLAGATSLIP
jgi:hypothetical protein